MNITIEANTVQWLTSIFGILFGLLGSILGVINYLRESPKVVVSLIWDMKPFGNTGLDSDKRYGAITVANIGRRPIYISHAHIKIEAINELILISDSIAGKTLLEGDSPIIYSIIQEKELKQYSAYWKKMRAVVVDSAGKEYFSKTVKVKPNWVTDLK